MKEKEEMINQNNLRILLFVLLFLRIGLKMQALTIKETLQTSPEYRYTGYVKDSISGEPLVYATVSFANEKRNGYVVELLMIQDFLKLL